MEYAQVINLLWERKIDFYQLLKIASDYEQKKYFPEAAVLYKIWLDRNDSPINAVAEFNLGVIYFSSQEYENSAACYERVKKQNPSLLQASINLGLAREKQALWDAACDEWKAVELHADKEKEDERKILISAFNNIARLQENRKIYDDAELYLRKSLLLDPAQEDVLHHLVFVRARQCLWPVYEAPEGVSLDLMKSSTSALANIALTDDPAAQLRTAKNYAEKKAPLEKNTLSNNTNYGHKKIRIGYCSSDFSLHPVSMLTVELFELHDREKFEIFGFCWSPNDGSELRERVITAFDQYIQIGHLSDEEAAKKIRSLEIDILVDLQGQTAGARMKMLAWRPAPVQVTYLGLPATTGMSAIDYVIADKYLIPEELAKFYSEKMIYMPDVYQVSDRQRKSSPAKKRSDYGLPLSGFIFCSFNNNYKYTQDVFEAWMNILKRVPDSVLWLLADNPISVKNLVNQAKKHGVDSDRLIFSERAAPADYLAKYLVADLFLDTFPFNAGTTANDALWMELPVLTMSGQAFASRMAGALLNAAGLTELITSNLTEYEDKAVYFANNASKIKKLKSKLNKIKKNGILFDTPAFVKNLELKFSQIIEDLPLQDCSDEFRAKSNLLEVSEYSVVDVVTVAEEFIRGNDKKLAIDLYEKFLKVNAGVINDWVVNFNIAILFYEIGDYGSAKSHLKEVLNKNPNFKQAHGVLSLIEENESNMGAIM